MSGIIICDQCKRSVKKTDTLEILDIRDGRRKRLCRDCQFQFYLMESKDRGMKLGTYGKFSDKQARDAEGGHVKWSKDIKNGK